LIQEKTMSEITIVPLGQDAAIVLPEAVIESAGLRIGDKVDLTVSDRQLILGPLEDPSRESRFAEITQDVFDRRADAYRRLA
jgi:antitoxin component of MazEF toxin-antitoxin module